MKTRSVKGSRLTKEKASLRRRVRRFYEQFNRGDWPFCFGYLDPRLREQGKVELSRYSESLSNFQRHYGPVNIWHMDLSLHLNVQNGKNGERDFAYVYIFWQDQHHAFHVFRERWVKLEGAWFTRVVGLVAHQNSG
jgi:hypothetical protein